MSVPQNWQQVYARLRGEIDAVVKPRVEQALAGVVRQINQALANLSAQDMENLRAFAMSQDLSTVLIHLLIRKGVFTFDELNAAGSGLAHAKTLEPLFDLLLGRGRFAESSEAAEVVTSDPAQDGGGSVFQLFGEPEPDTKIFGGAS